ncbi:phosphopantetheine-binding protein [Enterocloster clostridioformis]
MDREEIKCCIKAVIEDVKHINYTDDLFIQELGELSLDSISFVKLLVKLEVIFDITFGEELILVDQNTTVNDFIDLIDTIIEKKRE